MKGIISILIFTLFLASHSYSQIYLQSMNDLETEYLNINSIKDVTLIEVYIRKSPSSDISVKIDYGQKGYSKNQVILDKPNGDGNMEIFNSKMHVLNYFENRGWELLDINSESLSERNVRTAYYFRKK